VLGREHAMSAGQFGELRIDQFMHDGALFLIVFELVSDLRICVHIAEVQ
jgi:hypothetical protein